MKCYAHFGESSACYAHRILYPTRYCGFKDFPGHDFALSLTDPYEDHHCYHIYGLMTPRTLQCVGEWKGKGGKLVWSIDDNLAEVPESNPYKLNREQLGWWWLSRDIADLIICSTPALAAAVNRPHKTAVARNLMEIDGYKTTVPYPVQGKVRVLWSGSRTHSKDLELLEEPITRVLQKHGPDKVEFVFVGSAPGRSMRDHLNRGVHLEPGVSLGVYPDLISVIKPQIVLAPLDDCDFNRAKSAIRILEAGCLAAPVVASPVGEYETFTQHGQTGFHARTPDEWFEALDTLISDPDLCVRMGTAARKRVSEIGDWGNPDCRGEWRAAFQRVVDLCE